MFFLVGGVVCDCVFLFCFVFWVVILFLRFGPSMAPDYPSSLPAIIGVPVVEWVVVEC